MTISIDDKKNQTFLIKANKMGLEIPIVLPKDRSLARNPLRSIRNTYLGTIRREKRIILNDITLSLMPGDRLAVIGPNGAGKTTLLRTLGGVYKPNLGSLILNCKPRGLFDVSLGFNAQATGLENIKLRALDLGFSRYEVDNMIPEVISRSELGDYIHMPLETYSSGMRLRLAISVSLYAQPDVMLLDEWIGSGDARFQKSITERMDKMIDNARGLILASHNNSLLKRVCKKSIVVKNGAVVFSGSVEDGIDYYREKIVSK